MHRAGELIEGLKRFEAPLDINFFHKLPELVLFDTEYTAWEGSMQRNWTGPGEVREMYMAGLLHVRREADNKLVEVTGKTIFVKTVIVPKLPEYSINLTGVTQEQLDSEGVPYQNALDLLHEFSRGGEIPIVSYGTDRNILAENCELLKCLSPKFSGGFFDVRPAIRAIDSRTHNLSSGQLYTLVPGAEPTGQVHNALHDVKSIFSYLNWIA